MKLIKDLGMQYPTEKSKHKKRFGLYECPDCKDTFKAASGNVNSKTTKRCLKCSYEKRSKHEHSGTKIYNAYNHMKQRCYNIKSKEYKHYGGRGINICDEWLDDFNLFYVWSIENGHSKELSIDRINNDKGYAPENCRWTTQKVQNRNTRRIKINNKSGYRGVSKRDKKWGARITIDGKQISLGRFDTKEEAAMVYDSYIIDNKLEHTTNQEAHIKSLI